MSNRRTERDRLEEATKKFQKVIQEFWAERRAHELEDAR